MAQQAKTKKPAVKICGVTLTDDVAHCCQRGVDFVGFNFYRGSKRFIQPENAAGLWQGVRTGLSGAVRTRPVAVIVDHEPRDVAAVIAQFPALVAVQVHRALSAEKLRSFRDVIGGRELWMAMPLHEASDLLLPPEVLTAIDLVLFDSAHVPAGATVAGGSGQSFDWSRFSSYQPSHSFGVAGGVTAANLPVLAAHCRPDLVDVCSGVEQAPGRKDPVKIDELINLMTTLW